MRHILLSAGLLAATLAPAAAEVRLFGPGEIYRDSDGSIISILYKDGTVVTDLPEYYYRDLVFFTDTDVVSATGGGILEFSPTVDGGLPDTVTAGDVTLAVERSGSDVFLRDTATGARYATQTRRISGGKAVNPKRYGLD